MFYFQHNRADPGINGMNYQEYIKAELLVLIPVLYILGLGLKKSRVKDKWIPLSVGFVGILLSAAWVFSTSDIFGTREILYAVFVAITQGILVAGASVYANQLYVQAKKNE